MTYIDGLIGDILAEMEGNRTIVALIGDHGWSLGERGEFAKYGNFEEKTRVPFVVYDPRVAIQWWFWNLGPFSGLFFHLACQKCARQFINMFFSKIIFWAIIRDIFESN